MKVTSFTSCPVIQNYKNQTHKLGPLEKFPFLNIADVIKSAPLLFLIQHAQ